MGSDVGEGVENLPCSFKVHCAMCTKLKKLVDRILKIFPEIEAARPRCSSGIQVLCLLNNALERAKQLLQHCSESSKLYLAITGDVILSRCRRARNSLEQNLDQIQSMVPVMLALEISEIIADLRATMFVLDSSEEQAGKVVRELMQQTASTSVPVEVSEIRAVRFAAFNLQITTPKAIVIEKRSLKRLLDKVGDSDSNKRKILKYLLYLLRNYENVITGENKENSCPQREDSLADGKLSNSPGCAQSIEVESCGRHEQHGTEFDASHRVEPPEEFRCPLSAGLMYDPVVIASGQTYERVWIQKWLDEGNDTCPKTKKKLDHLLVTPNTVMKDLISKWCSEYGISIPDPSRQLDAFPALESSSISIASFGSSMYNLQLPSDVSSISMGTSYNDLHSCQTAADLEEGDSEFLSKLAELPWASQIKVIEDVKSSLKYNDKAFRSMSAENFMEPLTRFLKDAQESHDFEALRAGSQLVLAFLTKNRRGIESLSEDAFILLSHLLDSEAAEEALNIIEVLSAHPHSRSKIASSGALQSILKIIDSQVAGLQEQALITLQNLSLCSEVCLELLSLHCIPKLVPLLQDNILARNSIIVLRNLCNTERGWISLAETNGSIGSIAELLGSGSRVEQENAVAILLSLCSQRLQYCQMVMSEGVIPPLVLISINGNEKAKVFAMELLRILRDVEYGDEGQSSVSDPIVPDDAVTVSKESKSSSKTSKFFRLRVPGFSKKR